MCSVRGDAERAIPFIGVANLIYANNAALPTEIRDRISLNCRHVYVPPFQVPDPDKKRGNLTLTYASQIHACVVEIDEDTGEVGILEYAAVDDCGVRINPQIVEGQVHGATALGIGAALYEAFDYDEQGQLQQASFYDYHAITALDSPHIKTGEIESPSPVHPQRRQGHGRGRRRAAARDLQRDPGRARTRGCDRLGQPQPVGARVAARAQRRERRAARGAGVRRLVGGF